MSSFSDHFSAHARDYARHRPRYPRALFDFLAAAAPARRLAWDCGAGNGQAALELAKDFDHVVATDASAEQIAQAPPHDRVTYRVERAEDVSLAPGIVDLVTVAVAVHWFNLDLFYAAVRRVAAPGGLLAVWTYHLTQIEPAVDRLVERYYSEVLAGFWPPEIRYIHERYQTLPFPFELIPAPEFEMTADWTLDQFAGFLDSWSATQRYRREQGRHPLDLVWPALTAAWGDPAQPRRVRWPLHLKVGRIN